MQFLRGFRDNQILRTFAGSSFMYAFNAWYYSYSPTVANYISANEQFRSGMRFFLYPLVGILHVSSETFSMLAFEPELAALVGGIVASTLIGAVYLALPSFGALWLFRRRLNRSTMRATTKRFAWLLTALIAAFVVSELLMIGPVMMVTSAAIALTALAVGSLVPATALFKYAEKRR